MRIDTVNRDPTPVIYAASGGDWQSIPEAAARAFALLEAAITPHGRKIYGYWHPPLLEYRACYASEAGDVAPTVGLRETVIPGGRYRGARLAGDDVYDRIPEAFETLEADGDIAEDGRPWFEFYRRHDQVEVLVPISAP